MRSNTWKRTIVLTDHFIPWYILQNLDYASLVIASITPDIPQMGKIKYLAHQSATQTHSQ